MTCEVPESSRTPAIVGLCAIFIIVNVTVGYMSYHVGYYRASDVAHLMSNISYSEGISKGYDAGVQSGYDEGVQSGYDLGYVEGLSDGGRGYNIRDPTYSEALRFKVLDKTDRNKYNYYTYNCHDFTADFKNNAFNEGYRCGYVYLEFADGVHALVCFSTVDRGLIYIEPQDDEIMTLRVGWRYWDRQVYDVDYDDTIVRFDIIW